MGLLGVATPGAPVPGFPLPSRAPPLLLGAGDGHLPLTFRRAGHPTRLEDPDTSRARNPLVLLARSRFPDHDKDTHVVNGALRDSWSTLEEATHSFLAVWVKDRPGIDYLIVSVLADAVGRDSPVGRECSCIW